MELYLKTPFTQAVLELFKRLSYIAENEYHNLKPG